MEKKESFFHPSCLYLLVCFQGSRPHFVLLPFCYCLNTGSREPTAASHEPVTQQWSQRNTYWTICTSCACCVSLDSSGSLRICKNYRPGLEGWLMLHMSIFHSICVFENIHRFGWKICVCPHTCKCIYMEARWYVIHATSNHDFVFVQNISIRPWHDPVSKSLHKLLADFRVGVPKVGAAGVPLPMPLIQAPPKSLIRPTRRRMLRCPCLSDLPYGFKMLTCQCYVQIVGLTGRCIG